MYLMYHRYLTLRQLFSIYFRADKPVKIIYISANCAHHHIHNVVQCYNKRMDVKRKPAQTIAPVPIFAVHGCRIVRVGWVVPDRKAA